MWRQKSMLLALLLHSSMENLLSLRNEEKRLGTQMFNLHRWYLRMAKDEGKMFGVKYRDNDFFRGEEDSCVYFKNLYHIYHRQALYASIITERTVMSPREGGE